VGYALKRAQHALRAAMDDALRGYGVTTPQYAALAALERTPGLSGAELARQCFVTPQTMNAIVANLEAAGLVIRRPAPDHGRILRAELTPASRPLLRTCHQAVEAVEARMVAGLDTEERRHLVEALGRCVAGLGDSRRGPPTERSAPFLPHGGRNGPTAR
jgi:DNA-binding MarR family transcriptional regulator